MRVFKNVKIDGKITDLVSDNGVIAEIGKTDREGIDIGGREIIPGLVDIHSHGCIGFDTMDGIYLDEMSEEQARHGVSAWLPTTMTESTEKIAFAVNRDIASVRGAEVLGFHMEGPYISAKYKGAQNEEFIKKPTIAEFETFQNMKMVTLAPEYDEAFAFIKNTEAVVSIGHTDADFDISDAAMKAGARCLTHTFNAMPPLHHRNPGPIGAAIENNAYVQVICDGIHIHRAVITALYRIFGKERMLLISDSMRATGLNDGEYEFGGQRVIVRDGIARTEDGALAGSTSNLMTCVKKAIEFGIPRNAAIEMASKTPSELIGVKKGSLKPGYDADFAVVDEALKVFMTVNRGEIIYDSGEV